MKNLLAIPVLFAVFCLSASVSAIAQPLRDINYAYLYDPDAAISFSMKPVRGDTVFTLLYSLQVKDTANLMEEYSIGWESREMLSDREGANITWSSEVNRRNTHGMEGRLSISLAEAPKYIAAKIIKQSARRAWLFYTPVEPELPTNNFLVRGGSIVLEPFIHAGEEVTLGNATGKWIVSYYDDVFPPAAPAFSETQAKVAARMEVDSAFTVSGGDMLRFSAPGLYLMQKDTAALRACSFRVEEDYPQYSKLAKLPDPLVYISTRQEYERLQASRGNKKAFDRVILNMVSDTERARRLMRSYFTRVELANRYFTSYKEGWKTDRGMIYIIFGKPDQVYKFNDREVWSYKNARFDITFEFTRSPSLFDPDNYVLIRKKKYADTWYEVIDLWRNARF